MRRARFEGSAPYLWALAAALATVALCLDAEPPRPAPPPPTPPGPTFFELPPLPPPALDAGIAGEARR